MVYSLLLYLCVLKVLGYSNAIVSCRISGGGRCDEVDPLHWCQNGRGIGCRSSGQEPYKHSRDNCYKHRGYCGALGSSEVPGGGPRNLSVVATPSLSSRYKSDLFVQWEAPPGAVTGYEVLVLVGQDGIEYCACLNQSETQLVIRDIDIRTGNTIGLQVRSLPYSRASINLQTTHIAVKESEARDECWAAASNQHCTTSPLHTMTYTLMEASAVIIETRGDPSYLWQVQMSWNARQGLGVVIDLNDPTHPSPGSLDCTSPNRTIPCFIATTSTPVILTGLNATYNYTANIYEFNPSLCPGFNPSHLFSGCGLHCCDNPITISPKLSSSSPPNVTIVKTEFDDALPNTTDLSFFSPSQQPLLTNIDLSPSVLEQPLSHFISSSTDISHLPPLSHEFDDLLPTPLPLVGTTRGYPSGTTPSTTPSPVTVMLFTPHRTSTTAVNNYVTLTITSVIVGVAIIGTLVLVLLLVFANKMKKKNQFTTCLKFSQKKPRVELQNAGYTATDCGIIAYRSGSNSASNHPLLISSSSSSATPSPLPANEAVSLQHFASSPNALLPTSTGRPFTRSTVPTIPVATSSPLENSFDATATVQAPSYSRGGQHSSHPLAAPPPELNLLAKQARSSVAHNEVGSGVMAAAAKTPPEMLAGSVLIIYSPSIDSSDRERILQHLVGGLTQYGIPAHCHDTAYIKNPCQWMEHEIQKAHAVLCVCNHDFYREWDEGTARGKIPIVGLLKHLVHATLSRGDNLAKFATVLLDPGDSHWIPSLYLQGDPRQFLVTEVEEIARFIRNVPSYAPPIAPPILSSCATPTVVSYSPPTASLCPTPTMISYVPPPAIPPSESSCAMVSQQAPPTATPTRSSCVTPTVMSYSPPTNESPYISSDMFL